MSIRRNITRTILNTVETTKETSTLNSDELAFVLDTPDFFYVGFQGKFASRYFSMGTANTNSVTLTVEYYDESTQAWTAVEDLVDETQGFKNSGFIHWQNVSTWGKTTVSPIDDVELYWVRISTSAILSAGTTLQATINLFSDDVMLRTYWPELITDTRFLPASRTDFLEQHVAAKDLVVLRLRQRRLIDEEAQVIDINQVSIAAIHACAWIILNPIARTDEMLDLANRAFEAFNNEINELAKNVDKNKDGVISKAEKADLGEPEVLRR